MTGSASGIGAATAALLRERGAMVIGCDLSDADIQADLSTSEGRQALVDQVAERGPIDAVLAIAGGAKTGLLQTNYFGTVATLEGLRPLLTQSEAPRAVVVSSTSSLAPADERVVQAFLDGDEAAAVAYIDAEPSIGGAAGAYGIAKRALNRWVRRAAATPEWAGAGIALNAVAPGVVDTPASPGSSPTTTSAPPWRPRRRNRSAAFPADQSGLASSSAGSPMRTTISLPGRSSSPMGARRRR
ncbi:SDR family oxidoreductase [Amycolatopsis sp. NPDC051071]|uniref:SDR family oxidoreductase n=1 Tax=Amycolatopsis sp. NPDC051071 TaxID=3154637 RepID=UPI0034277322